MRGKRAGRVLTDVGVCLGTKVSREIDRPERTSAERVEQQQSTVLERGARQRWLGRWRHDTEQKERGGRGDWAVDGRGRKGGASSTGSFQARTRSRRSGQGYSSRERTYMRVRTSVYSRGRDGAGRGGEGLRDVMDVRPQRESRRMPAQNSSDGPGLRSVNRHSGVSDSIRRGSA